MKHSDDFDPIFGGFKLLNMINLFIFLHKALAEIRCFLISRIGIIKHEQLARKRLLSSIKLS